MSAAASISPMGAAVDLTAEQLAVITERGLVEAWRRDEYLEKEVREYERVVLGRELRRL